MLVFADAERICAPRAELMALRARLAARRDRSPRWIERHASLAALLVDASEIVQGLLDEDFRRTGRDGAHALECSALHVVFALAQALRSSFLDPGSWPGVDPGLVDALLAKPLPEQARVRVLEGYAHYALYPETYLVAADAARSMHTGPWCIIGIRSIGIGLAACVAASLNARSRDTFSVRPTGHPFARTIAPAEAWARRVLEDCDRRAYAIVDEGPGLSGSSFGAIADWLEDRGAHRVHFFPSHGNALGPHGSARHRERWARCSRHVVDFDAIFVREHAICTYLARWFPEAFDRAGSTPENASLEDLSAGAWRAHRFPHERDWPACIAMRERRKFLLRADGKPWLLRFAGLGHYGESALARARSLASAGLIPRVLALRHGFMAGEWLERSIPLPAAPAHGIPIDRASLLDTVARHMTFLARTYPALDAPGARPPQLLEMLTHNLNEAIGAERATCARATWSPSISQIDALHLPVRGDNKMHAWEWLIDRGGRIVKADALDHHRAHDLIGVQDIGWDIAAARVELDLSDTEYEMLIRDMARRTNRPYSRTVLAFYELAYVSFQWALHALEGRSLPDSHPESPRLRAACTRYSNRARALVETGP